MTLKKNSPLNWSVWRLATAAASATALLAGCSSAPLSAPVFTMAASSPLPLMLPEHRAAPVASLPGTPLRLDVREAVALALVQGPGVVGGTLDRESQRILNESAARMFEPRASLISSYERNSSTSSTDRTVFTRPFYGVRTSIKSITGGELKAELSGSGTSSANSASERGRASIELTQPLLRGGGTRIGTLEMRALSLSERASALGLESVRRAAVADAFNSYYALYEARQSSGIAQRALLRARQSVTTNQLLVETGRLARVDLLQTRADVARAELRAEQDESLEREAERRLAVVLGLPLQTQFELPPLTEEPLAPAIDADEALASAWNRRIDVRLAADAISTQRFGLERAQDDLLPRLDLSLRSEYAVGRLARDGALMDAQRPRSNTVALSLEIPLTRSELHAARSAAVNGVRRSEIALQDLRVGIEAEIRNAIEGFASARRALALAQTTLELQRGRLDAESEKLKAGRASTSQVSDAQEAVRSAEREDLSARLDLVRKSFEFDQSLGRSVEMWSRTPVSVPVALAPAALAESAPKTGHSKP